MILLKKAIFFLASSPFSCLELVIIKKSGGANGVGSIENFPPFVPLSMKWRGGRG
jgi:hypothetical protein